MLKKTILRFIVSLFLFQGGAILLHAQPANRGSVNDSLTRQILKLDSALFAAFNNRDLEQFKTFFTEDLEFYHDKGGLTNYDHTIHFMKETAQKNNQLNRQLVQGSLEVYPIPGFGAMEMGAHRFCHMEYGRQNCNTFRFIHIWKMRDGEWKISRIISYGH